MKLKLEKNNYSLNPVLFMRQAGYGIIHDRFSGQDSYVRHLGKGRYPRFHAYVDDHDDAIVINLHLDQKAASYPGAHAHNAEYDGETTESEMIRLKGVAHDFLATSSAAAKGDIKKNWWQKLFS